MDNIKLVDHSKMALREKWGYVYGTFGTKLDEPLLQQKLKQYPSNVKVYEDFIRKNWMNKRVADCVGLIKSYLWWNNGNVKYTAATDKSANGMYQASKKKGQISNIPEIPGILVWKGGHIGVYIGNGQVIESRGTKQGVIQSPLVGTGSANWTNWCYCPYIEYKSPVSDTVALKVNGRAINVEGYVENGVTYIKLGNIDIPLRELFESLGFKVSWDNKDKQVIING